VKLARQWAAAHDAPVFLVGSANHLVGVVTRQQLQDSESASNEDAAVTQLASKDFTHTHADHPVDVVLDRLAESGGLLPVVSRADIRKVDGVITAESLLSWRVERRLRSTDKDTTTAATVLPSP
jgi:CBS domain-containing protein